MRTTIVFGLGAFAGLILEPALGLATAVPPLRLQAGYVYRLRCPGKLLVSAVGNDGLLRLEALPRELGCGAMLKPTAPSGRTNLVLETSSGTLIRAVEIIPHGAGGFPSLEIALTDGGSP